MTAHAPSGAAWLLSLPAPVATARTRKHKSPHSTLHGDRIPRSLVPPHSSVVRCGRRDVTGRAREERLVLFPHAQELLLLVSDELLLVLPVARADAFRRVSREEGKEGEESGRTLRGTRSSRCRRTRPSTGRGHRGLSRRSGLVSARSDVCDEQRESGRAHCRRCCA